MWLTQKKPLPLHQTNRETREIPAPKCLTHLSWIRYTNFLYNFYSLNATIYWRSMYNNLHHFHHGCTFNFFHFDMFSAKSPVTFLFPPCLNAMQRFLYLEHSRLLVTATMVTCITILTVGHKCSEDFLLAHVWLIFGSFWWCLSWQCLVLF